VNWESDRVGAWRIRVVKGHWPPELKWWDLL
jgi:hypothetical protein